MRQSEQVLSAHCAFYVGRKSQFHPHTGDRRSSERYCCITAVAPLLLHYFALFAANNCVSCRVFALRCTQVFVTHLADSQKVSMLHFWQAIAKWRQQGHPRIWDDVSQVSWWQAQWFQDLKHELIMCVVRGWACEVRCSHDDWHVEVALFPLCSCVSRIHRVDKSDEQP